MGGCQATFLWGVEHSAAGRQNSKGKKGHIGVGDRGAMSLFLPSSVNWCPTLEVLSLQQKPNESLRESTISSTGSAQEAASVKSQATPPFFHLEKEGPSVRFCKNRTVFVNPTQGTRVLMADPLTAEKIPP